MDDPSSELEARGMSPATLSDAANQYVARGWPIFPCCRRGKAPITERGFRDATTDPDTVAAWWAENPDANIGFVPGRVGLLVLDIDGPNGEREAQDLGLFSEPTLTVTTGRGRHLYFHHPGGQIGNRKLAAELDVRADAGYVLLPPSVHPSGRQYRADGTVEWIKPLSPAALEALRKPKFRPIPSGDAAPVDSGTPRRVAYVRAAIEQECMELAQTPEGGRNEALNRAAFALARFIATGEADPEKLADALRYAAHHAGLPDWEIERTIRSAFDARGVVV